MFSKHSQLKKADRNVYMGTRNGFPHHLKKKLCFSESWNRLSLVNALMILFRLCLCLLLLFLDVAQVFQINVF